MKDVIECFKEEFKTRRNDLIEDPRKPESKRNGTGNLWKYSLGAGLVSAGYNVVLEKKHQTYKNGEEYTGVKSDLSVYEDGKLLAVRASAELSRLIKSYREQSGLEVVGILFQGRNACGDDADRVEKECKYYDENVSIVTMIDDKRKTVGGKLQTIINTDFDIHYDRINDVIGKLK